jgi:hypothetical protein
MEENLLVNKDLAVRLCNSIELVYNSASELKSVKEEDYEPILEHFEIIGDFFKIKNKLGILLLCYFINRRLVKGKPYITLNELMMAFECKLVDSISINEQLEYFRKAKILLSSKKIFGNKEDIEYSLTPSTLNSVLKGDSEILIDKKEASFTAFLNLFHGVLYDNELNDDDVSTELSVLMDEFEQLEEIKYLKGEKLCQEELAILLFIIARQFIFGDSKVSMERIFRVAINDNFSKYYYQNEIIEKRSPLLTNELVQFAADEFMNFLQITDKTVKALNLVERKSNKQFTTGTDLVTLIMPDQIKYQEGMVYEDSLNIDFLDQLISEEGYIKAINKLEQEGVAVKQVVCMLSGLSGTGKSQTIRNLASKYNRPILQVNLSQVKDAFVGKTEQNVFELFQCFKRSLRHFEHYKTIDGVKVGPYGTSILYLDEIDSLIPKRSATGESSSVGNMYSNMVGIFLTELEKVNGIVLLATNLPGAIDTSFHRRINFKFHFGSFSKKNQVRTLQLYFKDFAPEVLEEVASNAELTPGNIVNIRKAYVLESIFKDFNTENEKKGLLSDLVNRELILKQPTRNPIGFTYKTN